MRVNPAKTAGPIVMLFGGRQAHEGPRIYDRWATYRCHLANTIKRSVRGGDAVVTVTVVTCSKYKHIFDRLIIVICLPGIYLCYSIFLSQCSMNFLTNCDYSGKVFAVRVITYHIVLQTCVTNYYLTARQLAIAYSTNPTLTLTLLTLTDS